MNPVGYALYPTYTEETVNLRGDGGKGEVDDGTKGVEMLYSIWKFSELKKEQNPQNLTKKRS